VRRFAALGWFLVTSSSGAAALRMGLPLFSAIGILATVIFSTSGLDASTVVQRAESSSTTRLVLLLAWSTVTLPVVRAIWSTRENAFLRALPIPRWQVLLWLGALLALAELPWFVLWTRGGGVARGLGATLTALALHACMVARVRTWTDGAFVSMTCVAWLASVPAGRIVAGTIVSALAISRAWQRAPELRGGSLRSRISGPPALALGTAYALIAFRRHGATLLRAAIVVSISMAWAGFGVRNDAASWSDSSGPLQFVLAVWIPSSVFAAASLAGPVLRTDAAAGWVLAVCGTSMYQRRAATMGMIAIAGAAVGLLVGASLGVALDLPAGARLCWGAALGLAGAALSALTEVGVRWSIREEGHDAGRVVLAVLALVAVAEGVLWLCLAVAR